MYELYDYFASTIGSLRGLPVPAKNALNEQVYIEKLQLKWQSSRWKTVATGKVCDAQEIKGVLEKLLPDKRI